METNKLFPIFLKLDQINTLIVGGGNVGLEKLNALIINDPSAKITIVADIFLENVLSIAKNKENIKIIKRKFKKSDLKNKQLVILATDDKELHKKIKTLTDKMNILTNVADTPNLCHFYLGSVVTKGNLKIGISTNGKSPTLSKQLRRYFEDFFPMEIDNLLDNLNIYRSKLKDDFKYKINKMNEITSVILEKIK